MNFIDPLFDIISLVLNHFFSMANKPDEWIKRVIWRVCSVGKCKRRDGSRFYLGSSGDKTQRNHSRDAFVQWLLKEMCVHCM